MLSIIGVAAVVAIIGLIWWYGTAWAINKVRILWAKASKLVRPGNTGVEGGTPRFGVKSF
ncbi:hypothetical protein [Streptomyces sp. NPDC048496]|uniref:hypothetical protein n=1 Tax=Streptomyces sp. NPDC048496 TaxID=3365558 RepID=UPI003717BCB9